MFAEMYDPEDVELMESAAKIQAGFRGHQARKDRKEEEESAVKIQASRHARVCRPPGAGAASQSWVLEFTNVWAPTRPLSGTRAHTSCRPAN